VWTQGLRSSYRRAYWNFLSKLIRRFWRDDTRMWMGTMVLLSAHHFLLYAREVADELERECRAVENRPLRRLRHSAKPPEVVKR
jgi:hypothetical protein